jgi:hypothetical protein
MILQPLSNVILPVLTYTLPYFCEPNITYSLEGTIAAFLFGVGLFILCWASGPYFVVRYGILLGLVFQVYNRRFHEGDNFLSVLIIGIIIHYFACINKTTTQQFCSVKTIFFDWLILIALFPTTAFVDLYARTSLFPIVLAYFVGSNLLGMAMVKLAEFVWSLSFESKSKDMVYFIRILMMKYVTSVTCC